jgi:tripartite-type tricarboxylate transporter receptor subunit TctC
MLRWIVLLSALCGCVAVFGQDYPRRPVRIVTSPVGGNVDILSRLIAPGLSAALGQPVIVENKPGGVIPGETVAKAPPDGYTVLCGTNLFLFGPLVEKTPYDPVTDFVPITLTTQAPNLLVVNAALPVKNVRELVALARARPGELNYSAVGNGGTSHLAVELFKSMTGTNIVRIPYSSISQESADLLGGYVQLTVASVTSSAPQIKSGRLRALALTSAQPSAVLPGIPTVAASGVPGYEAVNIYGIFAPARTPDAIINRLNQEIVRVILQPDMKEKLLSTGQEPVASSPQDLTAKMKSEISKWSKVIRDAGIRT